MSKEKREREVIAKIANEYRKLNNNITQEQARRRVVQGILKGNKNG